MAGLSYVPSRCNACDVFHGYRRVITMMMCMRQVPAKPLQAGIGVGGGDAAVRPDRSRFWTVLMVLETSTVSPDDVEKARSCISQQVVPSKCHLGVMT
jgi:hypothetical protein